MHTGSGALQKLQRFGISPKTENKHTKERGIALHLTPTNTQSSGAHALYASEPCFDPLLRFSTSLD